MIFELTFRQCFLVVSLPRGVAPNVSRLFRALLIRSFSVVQFVSMRIATRETGAKSVRNIA
jgi:hypothetical protein